MVEQNHHEVLSEDKQSLTTVQAKEEAKTFRPKLAGFWVRFWAYMIDLIVIASIGGLVVKPIFRLAGLAINNPPFILFSPYKLTMLFVALLYFLLMTKYLKQTVGKMICGIQVMAKNERPLTWSALVFREVIGRFISKVLLLPYLLVVFMPKKEALHDLFADTYVVHEAIYEQQRNDERLIDNKHEQLQEQPNI